MISTALSSPFDIELAQSITLTGRVILRELMGGHHSDHHMCEKLWSEVYLTSKTTHRALINKKNLPPPFDEIKRQMEKIEPWTLMVQLRGHWFQCGGGSIATRTLTRLDQATDDNKMPPAIWTAKFTDDEILDVEGDRFQMEKDLVTHKVFMK